MSIEARRSPWCKEVMTEHTDSMQNLRSFRKEFGDDTAARTEFCLIAGRSNLQNPAVQKVSKPEI